MGTINERVRMVRKDKNLTMEKFGEQLGVGKCAISLIESGKNGVTEQMTKAICREFNVDPYWLETGEGDMYMQTNLDDFAVIENILTNQSDFAKNVMKICSKLTPEDWMHFEHVARNIRKYMHEIEEQEKKPE